MKIKPCVITVLLIAAGAAGWAQQPPPGGPGGPGGSGGPGGPGGPGSPGQLRRGNPMGGDPMSESFFPPEMVMQNQKAIGLTADQQSAIRAEMQKTVAKFTDLQWQMSAEQETMASLMKPEKPDEKQVLAQLDKLLAIENEVKRIQIGTMVKIKNLLTPEQQAKLRELRSQMRPPFQGPPPGRPGGPQPPNAPPAPPTPGE